MSLRGSIDNYQWHNGSTICQYACFDYPSVNQSILSNVHLCLCILLHLFHHISHLYVSLSCVSCTVLSVCVHILTTPFFHSIFIVSLFILHPLAAIFTPFSSSDQHLSLQCALSPLASSSVDRGGERVCNIYRYTQLPAETPLDAAAASMAAWYQVPKQPPVASSYYERRGGEPMGGYERIVQQTNPYGGG